MKKKWSSWKRCSVKKKFKLSSSKKSLICISTLPICQQTTTEKVGTPTFTTARNKLWSLKLRQKCLMNLSRTSSIWKNRSWPRCSRILKKNAIKMETKSWRVLRKVTSSHKSKRKFLKKISFCQLATKTQTCFKTWWSRRCKEPRSWRKLSKTSK